MLASSNDSHVLKSLAKPTTPANEELFMLNQLELVFRVFLHIMLCIGEADESSSWTFIRVCSVIAMT